MRNPQATAVQIRTERRQALADELATIRAINGALLAPALPVAEMKRLIQTRADALQVVRRLLAQLHPGPRKPRARKEVQ
jgi:hypothetical protein